MAFFFNAGLRGGFSEMGFGLVVVVAARLGRVLVSRVSGVGGTNAVSLVGGDWRRGGWGNMTFSRGHGSGDVPWGEVE